MRRRSHRRTRPCRCAMSRSDVCRWPDWPGQSRDHLAMKVAIQPRRWARILVKVLNSAALSAALQRVVDADRRLEHAGPGLRVQALDLEIHPVREVEKLVIEIRVHAGAQHRIAEETRRDVLQIAIVLLAHGMRRLLEQEELELGRRRDREAHLLGLLQHAPQHAARAGRFRVAVELAQEERQVVLERNEPHGLGQHAHRGIRIGRVPAGERGVVVELIVRIPAQHHVAEAEALLEGGFELVAGHVLAAHDAVDIDDSDLHEGQIAAAHICHRIGGSLDLGSVHVRKPLSGTGMGARRTRAPGWIVSASCTRSRPW